MAGKMNIITKYEKGTLGWLRDQAKRDGFDSIRDWQIWKTKQTNKQIKQQENKIWTRNEIVGLIKRIYEKKRRVPTATDFDNNTDCPSSWIVRNVWKLEYCDRYGWTIG